MNNLGNKVDAFSVLKTRKGNYFQKIIKIVTYWKKLGFVRAPLCFYCSKTEIKNIL
jgi:hypothetical protein